MRIDHTAGRDDTQRYTTFCDLKEMGMENVDTVARPISRQRLEGLEVYGRIFA